MPRSGQTRYLRGRYARNGISRWLPLCRDPRTRILHKLAGYRGLLKRNFQLGASRDFPAPFGLAQGWQPVSPGPPGPVAASPTRWTVITSLVRPSETPTETWVGSGT